MFIVEYACSAEPAVVNRLIILITGNLKCQMFLYTVLNIFMLILIDGISIF